MSGIVNSKNNTESLAGGSTVTSATTTKVAKIDNRKASSNFPSPTSKLLSSIQESSKTEVGLDVKREKTANPAIGITSEHSHSSSSSSMIKMVVPGTETQEMENEEEKQKQQSPPVAAFEQKQEAKTEKDASKPIVFCLLCQSKLRLHPSLFKSNFTPTPLPTNSNLGLVYENNDKDETFYGQTSDANVPMLENMTINDAAITTNKSLLPNSLQMCQLGGSCNFLELIENSTSPLDVPMCKKCASSISAELHNQLFDLERECSQYKQSLDQLLKERENAPFDQEAAKGQLEQLKTEERELIEQLNFLDNEEQALQRQLEAKIEERRQINQREEELYRQLRDNHRTLIDQADEQRALKLQIRHAEEQLQRLTRTNVMDMVFHIWVDGEFGTISGFRLGRLRHEQVEWNEINAALGQTAFLLKVIAERLGMEFIGYEVVPCGNSSFIRVHKQSSDQQQNQQSGSTTIQNAIEELPLYGSGGWRPFGQAGLDKALVAFMDCFIQVEQRLKQYFPPGTQLLPYRMLKDKIVDKDSQYLVKMQLNSEERWTKAMKCLLLNLKRVIGILIPLPTLVAAANANNNQQQQQQHTTTSSEQISERQSKERITKKVTN